MYLKGDKLSCIEDCNLTDPNGNVLKTIKKGDILTVKDIGHDDGEVLISFEEIYSDLGSMEYDYNTLKNFSPYDDNT